MFRATAYRLKTFVFGRWRILLDRRLFLSQEKDSTYAKHFQKGKSIPIYSDYLGSAGVSSGHYFHQDLFFAREIFQAAPQEHFDLGSRIDGFIAHLASFRIVNVFDIRQLDSNIPGVNFTQLDVMDLERVKNFPKVQSLSCLHTAEHFGLGRYGDPVDFDGWDVGIRNLSSLVAPGGRFYFSVPIGKLQRIEFNAHRVFNPKFMTEYLLRNFHVVKMAAVRDTGDLDLDADFMSADFMAKYEDTYGCGLWVLEKNEVPKF